MAAAPLGHYIAIPQPNLSSFAEDALPASSGSAHLDQEAVLAMYDRIPPQLSWHRFRLIEIFIKTNIREDQPVDPALIRAACFSMRRVHSRGMHRYIWLATHYRSSTDQFEECRKSFVADLTRFYDLGWQTKFPKSFEDKASLLLPGFKTDAIKQRALNFIANFQKGLNPVPLRKEEPLAVITEGEETTLSLAENLVEDNLIEEALALILPLENDPKRESLLEEIVLALRARGQFELALKAAIANVNAENWNSYTYLDDLKRELLGYDPGKIIQVYKQIRRKAFVPALYFLLEEVKRLQVEGQQVDPCYITLLIDDCIGECWERERSMQKWFDKDVKYHRYGQYAKMYNEILRAIPISWLGYNNCKKHHGN